jgi:integrase/recombinase XerD
VKRDPRTDDPNLFSFARDYLHGYMPKVQGLSPKTIEAYRLSLECFLSYLSEAEHLDREQVSFDEFDRAHLRAWLVWMGEQRHYARNTIALRLSAIKAFLTYASHEDITLVTLAQGAKALRVPACPRRPIDYLTGPETRALLDAFTGATSKSRRNRMLLILLYDTAARVSELTNLTLRDLRLIVPGHVTLTGKRNKTRTVPISSKTIEHLHVYLDEFHPNHAQLPATRPVFYSLHRGQPTPLSVDTVAAVLHTAAGAARAGCPTIPENIHCHLLRKTKAMDLYQQGVPLPIIMRLLGHENTSTTSAFYAFATLDMMRNAVNAATPALTSAPAQQLSHEDLQGLYDLR